MADYDFVKNEREIYAVAYPPLRYDFKNFTYAAVPISEANEVASTESDTEPAPITE